MEIGMQEEIETAIIKASSDAVVESSSKFSLSDIIGALESVKTDIIAMVCQMNQTPEM